MWVNVLILQIGANAPQGVELFKYRSVPTKHLVYNHATSTHFLPAFHRKQAVQCTAGSRFCFVVIDIVALRRIREMDWMHFHSCCCSWLQYKCSIDIVMWIVWSFKKSKNDAKIAVD
jgi:hypothetical protein